MIVKSERLKRAILVALADIESQKILELIRYASKGDTKIAETCDL